MTSVSRQQVICLCGTILLTIAIILVSIFSLKNGFFGIFTYFYILPIILLAYFYPRYAVYFTVVLGWIFIALV
jgi:hypothetical protein